MNYEYKDQTGFDGGIPSNFGGDCEETWMRLLYGGSGFPSPFGGEEGGGTSPPVNALEHDPEDLDVGLQLSDEDVVVAQVLADLDRPPCPARFLLEGMGIFVPNEYFIKCVHFLPTGVSIYYEGDDSIAVQNASAVCCTQLHSCFCYGTVLVGVEPNPGPGLPKRDLRFPLPAPAPAALPIALVGPLAHQVGVFVGMTTFWAVAALVIMLYVLQGLMVLASLQRFAVAADYFYSMAELCKMRSGKSCSISQISQWCDHHYDTMFLNADWPSTYGSNLAAFFVCWFFACLWFQWFTRIWPRILPIISTFFAVHIWSHVVYWVFVRLLYPFWFKTPPGGNRWARLRRKAWSRYGDVFIGFAVVVISYLLLKILLLMAGDVESNPGPKPVVCKKCNCKCKDYADLMAHLKTKHPKSGASNGAGTGLNRSVKKADLVGKSVKDAQDESAGAVDALKDAIRENGELKRALQEEKDKTPAAKLARSQERDALSNYKRSKTDVPSGGDIHGPTFGGGLGSSPSGPLGCGGCGSPPRLHKDNRKSIEIRSRPPGLFILCPCPHSVKQNSIWPILFFWIGWCFMVSCCEPMVNTWYYWEEFVQCMLFLMCMSYLLCELIYRFLIWFFQKPYPKSVYRYLRGGFVHYSYLALLPYRTERVRFDFSPEFDKDGRRGRHTITSYQVVVLYSVYDKEYITRYSLHQPTQWRDPKNCLLRPGLLKKVKLIDELMPTLFNRKTMVIPDPTKPDRCVETALRLLAANEHYHEDPLYLSRGGSIYRDYCLIAPAVLQQSVDAYQPVF